MNTSVSLCGPFYISSPLADFEALPLKAKHITHLTLGHLPDGEEATYLACLRRCSWPTLTHLHIHYTADVFLWLATADLPALTHLLLEDVCPQEDWPQLAHAPWLGQLEHFTIAEEGTEGIFATLPSMDHLQHLCLHAYDARDLQTQTTLDFDEVHAWLDQVPTRLHAERTKNREPETWRLWSAKAPRRSAMANLMIEVVRWEMVRDMYVEWKRLHALTQALLCLVSAPQEAQHVDHQLAHIFLTNISADSFSSSRDTPPPRYSHPPPEADT